MLHPKDIAIKDYDYNLPDERIAKYPLAQRDHSKLLVFDGTNGKISEYHFYNLPEHIPAGSMVVFNNTKVIQARLHFHKPTGGVVEVFCLEPECPKDYQQSFAQTSECTWTCLVGNSKKWKEGSLSLEVTTESGKVTLNCERVSEPGASQKIRFYWEGGQTFADLLDAMGELPIPPYLNRETEESDKKTYQTVYSQTKGSVAAPTAGLHYTPEVLDALSQKGVSLQYLTLHVGAGTFKPVKSDTIEGHDMHTEFISVPRSVIQDIHDFNGPMLIATGTTSVRTLESLYYIGNKIMYARNNGIDLKTMSTDDLIVHQWEPYDNPELAQLSTKDALQEILDYLELTGQDTLITATQILIAPGFNYHLVDAMVTNFHMPQSTLLLLVSAFLDGEDPTGPNWHSIYRYAMGHDFRFLSYGDSSMLIRKK